jgi:hypothetical protein
MGISKLNPSAGGIPFGDNAGRPANPGIGKLYSNGEIGRLELYTSTGWNNIVQETPGVAGLTGVYNQSAGSGTFVVSGTNFVDGAIAYAVGTNSVDYQAATTTYNSLVQLTVTFSDLSPAYEPYDLKIVNPSNLFGILPDAFSINDSPVWSTTAGSLGSLYGPVSIQLSATDDESASISYSVSSGSLPSGLTLSSSGLISGTITADPATYTFIVAASDGVNTGQTRSFSITVPSPVVTGGTLTSDSTYYYRTFTGSSNLVVSTATLNADVLIIAGAGGAGSDNFSDQRGGGGGGAGGVLYYSQTPLAVATHQVVIGGGGAGGLGSSSGTSMNGSNGVNSRLGSLVEANGGGYGGGHAVSTNFAGGSGGSGGGGSNGVPGGSSTQTSGSGYTAYGNSGGTGAADATYGGGGGGGSGAAGAAAVGGVGGNGGTGTNAFSTLLSGIGSAMTGVSGWSTATSTGRIAGGGGAKGTTVGSGGSGGGANGVLSGTGINGIANTGGGGGGTRTATAGSGGSGLVVVRYTKSSVGG